MRLKISQKIFTITDKFNVTDENDAIVYKVVSKLFSITNKRSVFDAEGNLLITVRRKLFRILPEFRIYDSTGQQIAKIKRKFSLLRKFKITSDEHEYSIEGDILSWNYEILCDGVPIGRLSKQIIHLTDSYILDVFDETNAPFFIACTLAIDLLYHSARSR